MALYRRTLAAVIVLGMTAGVLWAQEDGVSAAPSGTSTGASEEAPPQPNRYLSKLSADEPLYFVVGSRGNFNAKFQISFKYAFMNPRGGLSRRAPFFSHVFFGYTQTSLWDLQSRSKPFYDTSYKPSLFYRDEAVRKSADGSFRLGAQVGVQHESNGQGVGDSRSLAIIYLQPTFEWATDGGRGRFDLVPKVWTYIGDLSDNPDIADYRGYGNLRLAYTGPGDWQVAATLGVGTSGKGSVQLDATWPMDKILSRSFDAYLYAQIFDGWGESLRSYDQRLPWQFRLGIAVVR